MKSAGIIKDAKEIIYPGAPHGIMATHQDEINSELLRFVESWQRSQRRLHLGRDGGRDGSARDEAGVTPGEQA